MSDDKKNTWKATQLLHLKVLAGIVAVLWLVTLVDYLLPALELTRYGIRPRQVSGLWGIILAPFLHADWGHLLANTLPLIVLGWLAMLRGVRVFVIVCVLSMLTCGLGVWSLGENQTHVGASGIIFGLFGYLLLRGYFERSLGSLLVACAVGFFYGGLVWGFLPLDKDISWLGHVFGFAGGALSAWVLAPAADAKEKAAAAFKPKDAAPAEPETRQS